MRRLFGKLDAFLERGCRSGGYTRVPNILFRRATSLGITRAQLDVFEVLLSLRHGDLCCASVARIAHDAQLSERTVKSCVRKLEQAGLVTVLRDPYRYRRRRSNTYDLSPLVAGMEASLLAEPWRKYAGPSIPPAEMAVVQDAAGVSHV